MLLDPLAPPVDTVLLDDFLRARHLHSDQPATELLEPLATAFAALPYENLTKIIRANETGSAAEARRHPAEVLRDHQRLGTGGTCFALTATLLHLVRSLGLPSEPLLADRRYGPDTHCALLVWLGGRPHLLDPGHLSVRPVPLPEVGEVRLPTAFNEVVLTAREGGRKVDLHTLQQKQRTCRLTFKAQPSDAGEFLRAWDASFDWDMMHYPVLLTPNFFAVGKEILSCVGR
jgi:arylamine N-acetyltransferase